MAPIEKARMTENADSLKPFYHRVILKLSGESLCRAGERGISMEEVFAIAQQIKQALALGCQIGLVVGGGNILRARNSRMLAAPKLKRLPHITWECWPP